MSSCTTDEGIFSKFILSNWKKSSPKFKGGTAPLTTEIEHIFLAVINFFLLSSVQILLIPACCLLCVL